MRPMAVVRLLICAATSSPRRARPIVLSSARRVLNRPMTADEQRALSLTGASGGFAVPVTLDQTLIPTSNGAVNPWRAISRKEQIVGSKTGDGVTPGGGVASRVGGAPGGRGG